MPLGKAIKFPKGVTRTQMAKECRQAFKGIHGTKENTPEVADILSMLTMIPKVYQGKPAPDAPPRGPLHVRVFKVDSKTKADGLIKSFLPRMKYETKYPLHKMRQYQECQSAFNSPSCLVFQMNSLSGSDLNQLRLHLSEQCVELAFVKSTMVQTICKKLGHAELSAVCKGPLLLVYSQREPHLLKEAISLINASKRLLLIAGIIDGQAFGVRDCRQMINELSSKQGSIGQICALLQHPMKSIVQALDSSVHSFMQILDGRAKQLEKCIKQ